MAVGNPNLRFQAHLRTPSPDPDAGLRGLGHYERRLPKWRYKLRQAMIPLVRWETPRLAQIQESFRSPFLDSYFAMSANLGTHTFFMTALPICFWCGYPGVGVSLVHMLAAGVYFSGYLKDLVCLPRPLSPPLVRITMSGSAAMEYGFPSTHTTNAVSVAAYCLYNLWASRDHYQPLLFAALVALCICYAVSISAGRMYCGMHGFSDVVAGAILGALIAAVRVLFGQMFDSWILASSWTAPLLTTVLLISAVRFHPEPADNCPCFDDSVAFVGVVVGITLGTWSYAHNFSTSGDVAISLAQMYDYYNRDVVKVVARLVIGIVMIFVWRAAMKPLLLQGLPPIFRLVDKIGATLPRRHFLQAKDYNTVPHLEKDDKVLPPASEIPEMLSSIRRRKRTVSVGPQSEADAREHIASKEQTRRQAKSDAHKLNAANSVLELSINENAVMTPDEPVGSQSYLSVQSKSEGGTLTSPQNPQLGALLTPPISEAGASSDSGAEDESSNRAMFAHLEKPRVRYDVEVITKLVVYTGIAWITVEVNCHLFDILGIS